MDQTRTGALIRALRQNKQLTQRQLADAIGVNDKAASKWERGCGAPDIPLLPRLSQALDTSDAADVTCCGQTLRLLTPQTPATGWRRS